MKSSLSPKCHLAALMLTLVGFASASVEAASQEESVVTPPAHFELAPKFQAILDAGGEQAQLAAAYIKYATDLVNDVE